MNEQLKVNWYRCKVDKVVMSELMRTSDLRGFGQVIPQLLLFALTATTAYAAFLNVDGANWPWSVPLLLLALFVHGTFSSFMSTAGPVHELCHKTPFRTKFWNEFFLKIFSFLSWSDYVGFRPSHVKHHQVTVHTEHDGEVELPQKCDWHSLKFVTTMIAFDPYFIFINLRGWVFASMGEIRDWIFPERWMNKVVPHSNVPLRREHQRWARIVLFGHLTLAALFVLTGHWFLIIVFTFGCMYSQWFVMLCARPQHIGLSPNVPDFRLCCRTYTCGWLPAFLYWNMQYHVEHHMFPAVPFYNLPRLRKVIEKDLPPATHGLFATWKEILLILRKQRHDPNYVFVPDLPDHEGEHVADGILEAEAAANYS